MKLPDNIDTMPVAEFQKLDWSIQSAWIGGEMERNERRFKRRRVLRALYGVDSGQAIGLNEIDRCQICGREFAYRIIEDRPAARGGKVIPCVDHDHATGRVRGLLCKWCNTALGWYEARRGKIEEYLGGKACSPG